MSKNTVMDIPNIYENTPNQLFRTIETQLNGVTKKITIPICGQNTTRKPSTDTNIGDITVNGVKPINIVPIEDDEEEVSDLQITHVTGGRGAHHKQQSAVDVPQMFQQLPQQVPFQQLPHQVPFQQVGFQQLPPPPKLIHGNTTRSSMRLPIQHPSQAGVMRSGANQLVAAVRPQPVCSNTSSIHVGPSKATTNSTSTAPEKPTSTPAPTNTQFSVPLYTQQPVNQLTSPLGQASAILQTLATSSTQTSNPSGTAATMMSVPISNLVIPRTASGMMKVPISNLVIPKSVGGGTIGSLNQQFLGGTIMQPNTNQSSPVISNIVSRNTVGGPILVNQRFGHPIVMQGSPVSGMTGNLMASNNAPLMMNPIQAGGKEAQGNIAPPPLMMNPSQTVLKTPTPTTIVGTTVTTQPQVSQSGVLNPMSLPPGSIITMPDGKTTLRIGDKPENTTMVAGNSVINFGEVAKNLQKSGISASAPFLINSALQNQQGTQHSQPILINNPVQNQPVSTQGQPVIFNSPVQNLQAPPNPPSAVDNNAAQTQVVTPTASATGTTTTSPQVMLTTSDKGGKKAMVTGYLDDNGRVVITSKPKTRPGVQRTPTPPHMSSQPATNKAINNKLNNVIDDKRLKTLPKLKPKPGMELPPVPQTLPTMNNEQSTSTNPDTSQTENDELNHRKDNELSAVPKKQVDVSKFQTFVLTDKQCKPKESAIEKVIKPRTITAAVGAHEKTVAAIEKKTPKNNGGVGEVVVFKQCWVSMHMYDFKVNTSVNVNTIDIPQCDSKYFRAPTFRAQPPDSEFYETEEELEGSGFWPTTTESSESAHSDSSDEDFRPGFPQKRKKKPANSRTRKSNRR